MKNLPDGLRIDTAVSVALADVGFVIVTDASKADAVVEIEWAVEVIADGGPKDYPKNIFTVRLLDSDGNPLWQTRVRVLESRRERKSVEYQGRAIARALEKAWQKSAKRWRYPGTLRQAAQLAVAPERAHRS